MAVQKKKLSGFNFSFTSDYRLTLKLMSPFLQHKQASMRKMNVKRPEKETATTAREDGHDSSLRGAPPTGPKQRCKPYDGDRIMPACSFIKKKLSELLGH